MTLKKNILALRQKKAIVEKGGGDKAIEKQVAMGKMTARDRILALLDVDSFHEYDLFVEHEERNFGMASKELAGDGVITGTGTINGAPICIYAQDFTVMGGSLGLKHARKITKIMDHALRMKVPCIGINDSGGARIQEGISALAGYGEIFYRNTMSSGVIPQISVILGPCAGGAVYSPALTDFVFVVENISKMFITGPNVIETVLGEKISQEDLGGARVHAEITGNAHFYALSEMECLNQIKELVSLIPHSNQQKAERLYGVIDKSDFYRNDVAKANRSRMNVPFQLADSNLDKVFLEESFAAGLHALKGHRVVGGMRASIYNAMPLEGVKALTDFMVDFERRHG